MAGISITSQGANLNPTSDILPYRKGNKFEDSPLQSSSGGTVQTKFGNVASGLKGILLDPSTGQYALGDWANVDNGTAIIINDNGVSININGLITTTTGVHVASGTYLNLIINGSSYYLNLLT